MCVVDWQGCASKGGGGSGTKFCVPKMAESDFPDYRFRCFPRWSLWSVWGGGGVGTRPSVSDCLPLAAPTGLSPLLILTLCGPERVLFCVNGAPG